MLENKLMSELDTMRNALGLYIAGVAMVAGSAFAQTSVAQTTLFDGQVLGGTPEELRAESGTIASTSSGSLVWTHASGAENWIGTNVAVGDDGRFVLSQFQGVYGATRLFRTQDANPPTPVWQNSATYMAMSTRVDAARSADVQATLHFAQDSVSSTRVPLLSVYSSASAAPMWRYSFPFSVIMPRNGVHVSSDGETIVGWVYDFGTLSTAVAVFGRTSNTPRSFSNLATLGVPLSVKLSADGSTLYVASAIKTMILDVANGTIAYELYNSEGLGLGHAISGNGSVFARGLSQRSIATYRKQGSTYVPWFTYSLDTEASCMSLALSDDGSTMACGYNYGSPYQQVRTVVLNLATTPAQVVLDESVLGSGTLMNSMSDLALSARGDTVAVALSGDQNGAAPELLVYAKDASAISWSRAYQFDLPGSANDVDISADGTRIAVASKAVHMMAPGTGGRIDLFEVTPTVATADLTYTGVPSIGAELDFYVSGLTPGRLTELLVSREAASPPLSFPGVGVLYLKRDAINIESIGNADHTGTYHARLAIPLDPGLIGKTYYVQGLALEPSQLSHDWLQITILP
jgi:hypothetical protein